MDDRDERAGEDGEEKELHERVDRAMGPLRGVPSPEEWDEQRRMLIFLARTHPRLSDWIERGRPRAVPDRSGTVAKQDAVDLEAALRRGRRKAQGDEGP